MKWQDISVDVKTLSPGGCLPCPGAIYMHKIMKKSIQSDFKEMFLKLATNDRSDKRFLLTSKFRPLGCLPLTCGYIHLSNHEKMSIKSEAEEILFKMTIVMRPSWWHKPFGPNGLSAPAQGLYLNFFSSITTEFNISSALRWAIQDKWSSGLDLVRSENALEVTVSSKCPITGLSLDPLKTLVFFYYRNTR